MRFARSALAARTGGGVIGMLVLRLQHVNRWRACTLALPRSQCRRCGRPPGAGDPMILGHRVERFADWPSVVGGLSAFARSGGTRGLTHGVGGYA